MGALYLLWVRIRGASTFMVQIFKKLVFSWALQVDKDGNQLWSKGFGADFQIRWRFSDSKQNQKSGRERPFRAWIFQTELWQRLFFLPARKREGLLCLRSSLSPSLEMEQRDSSRSKHLFSREKAQQWKICMLNVRGPDVKQRAMEETILRRERASSRCQEWWRENRRRTTSISFARIPSRKRSPSKQRNYRDLEQSSSYSGSPSKFYLPFVLSRVFLNGDGKRDKLGSSGRGRRKETSERGFTK